MKIDIIISAGDIKQEKVQDKTVIVIDMLRATSVIATALANACKEVIPMLTIPDALELVNEEREKYILGGERKAVKIEGFDCSNSPLEYTEKLVRDKTIVLTTTNGTRAITGCTGARDILIGAMINGFAVANQAVSKSNDLIILNAGTYDEFSMDDFICSGYIIDCILGQAESMKNLEVELSDIAKTAHYIYESNKDIKGYIEKATHYKRLLNLGLKEDLEYCCQKSITDIVPVYKDGIIR
jgi:2-phosphosulfolactate phosphatase